MRNRIPLLLTPILAVSGSLAAFIILLALERPGWHSREHVAFTLWSLPLAGIVTFMAAVLRGWLRGRPGWARGCAAVLAGVGAGIGWAFASYFLSGGWVLAFDAPVLYCWTAGAIAALLVALLWPDMRRPISRTAAV